MQTNRGMQRSPKETESASRADDWFSTKCSKKIKLNVLRMCLKELQCQKDPGWSLAQGISKPLVSQQSLSNEVPRCQDSAGKQHVRKNRVVANTSSIFHLPNFLLPTESPQQQDDVKTCWTYRELQEAARKDKQKADLIERC